jgi:hypothetical protein
MRADAWHLRHDNHRRPRARDIYPLGDAIERDLATAKVLEWIVLLRAAPWHNGFPCYDALMKCASGIPPSIITLIDE